MKDTGINLRHLDYFWLVANKGSVTRVREQCFAISNERKIKHPAIDAILSAIHGKVFSVARRG